MFETIVANLVISLLLGAAIGLERQSSRRVDDDESADSGIRTFALTGLLGCLSAIFYVNNFPLVFATASAAFLVLIGAHYVLKSSRAGRFGLTTGISFILTFLIGAVAGTQILPTQLTVAIAVVVIVILSLKARSRKFLARVSRSEIESFISFAILALVVLPFLSNATYTLADVPGAVDLLRELNIDVERISGLELLNPRKLWFIVVLITGIDLLGYALSKYFGKKRGFIFTSFIGGFVSSTLTTQSLAQKSATTSDSNYLVGAALFANMAGFLQVFLVVGPLNMRWLLAIFPTLGILILTTAILGVYFLRLKEKPADLEHAAEDEGEIAEKKIFSIIPALQFALLLLVVTIVTKLCLILFGKAGFVASSVIASFAGIDAILVNLSGMAGNGITFGFALFTLILVNATNLLAKSFYCFLQGSRAFTIKFLVSVLIIIAASFAGLLFS